MTTGSTTTAELSAPTGACGDIQYHSIGRPSFGRHIRALSFVGRQATFNSHIGSDTAIAQVGRFIPKSTHNT